MSNLTIDHYKQMYKEQVAENLQLEQAVQYLQTALAGILFCYGAEQQPEEPGDVHSFEIVCHTQDLDETPQGQIKITPGEDTVMFSLVVQ